MASIFSFFSSRKKGDRINDKQIVQKTDLDNQFDFQSFQGLLTRLLPEEFCDVFLAEAIYEVVLSQLADSSFLQRSFSIEPIRADRMLYSMEVLGIVGKENDTHERNILIKDLKGLDSQIGVLNLYFKRNITFKDLFDKDVPNNLVLDKDAFMRYPNGLRLKFVEGILYYDSVIDDIISSLGYNNGELSLTFHDNDYSIVEYKDATIMAFWEIFTNKLICIARNNKQSLDYCDIFKIKQFVKRRYREEPFWKLAYGIEKHNISRSFVERVFKISNNIPYYVNKDAIIEALWAEGIGINTISEIIEKDYTYYRLETFGVDSSVLADMISENINKIRSSMHVQDLIVIKNERTVLMEIPNYSIIVDKFKFTFGGADFQWLSNCLYNGYSMVALTTLLNNDSSYKQYADDNSHDEKVIKEINHQAECYSKIDSDILNSKVSISKFRISNIFDDDYPSRINYIAMAAFYKQCDVLLDDFIESTDGDYEIISKNSVAGITITKVRAYHEVFSFTNGHCILDSKGITDNFNKLNTEVDCRGYIYVLVNPSFEGMVKIGKTTRDPNERVKELSSATGVPTPFILVYYKQFKDCNIAEAEIHQILESKGYRLNESREFFKLSPTDAIRLIQKYYDESES